MELLVLYFWIFVLKKSSTCLSNTSAEEDSFTKQWQNAMEPFRELLINNTMLTNAFSLTPEILLHLVESDPETGKQLESVFKGPQDWGTYFPGGQGLSRFILDYPQVVKGLKVLDLGSGCGAVAIAAAKSGASHVTACDIDPLALVAIVLNADQNAVSLNVATTDPIGSDPTDWDCIMVGDMFHDETIVQKLVPWLKKSCKLAVKVLLGDPERFLFRKYLDRFEDLELLANYKISEYHWKQDNEQYSHTKVWNLKCNT